RVFGEKRLAVVGALIHGERPEAADRRTLPWSEMNLPQLAAVIEAVPVLARRAHVHRFFARQGSKTGPRHDRACGVVLTKDAECRGRVVPALHRNTADTRIDCQRPAIGDTRGDRLT